MGNPHLHDSTTPPRMSVNVALCGSIPRSLMTNSSAPCGLQALSSMRSNSSFSMGKSWGLNAVRGENEPHKCTNNSLKDISSRPVLSERQPLAQIYEAPTWAVPAKGQTSLEVSTMDAFYGGAIQSFAQHVSLIYHLLYLLQPVCEGVGIQSPIDLTVKSLYRIGRAPNMDVQLMHGTSSRRHAMIFHHSNGSCYLVDCGSAHGTYVNGKRITAPVNGGMVVPHRVRRGSMIRFGGPGAPCFVLKSFSFKLDDVVKNDEDKESDPIDLVRRNTRLNALGSSSAASVRRSSPFKFQDDVAVRRKRSFDSLSTSATLDEDCDSHCSKRVRCSSPPLSPETSPLRLVSPDCVKRHVRFSADPPQSFYPSLVTPEDSLSAEEDNDEISV